MTYIYTNAHVCTHKHYIRLSVNPSAITLYTYCTLYLIRLPVGYFRSDFRYPYIYIVRYTL